MMARLAPAVGFLVLIPSLALAAPSVTSIFPTEGWEGTIVTIDGTDFSGVTGVSFDGVAAAFVIDSPTQITATCPIGLSTGPVCVTAGPESSGPFGTFRAVFATEWDDQGTMVPLREVSALLYLPAYDELVATSRWRGFAGPDAQNAVLAYSLASTPVTSRRLQSEANVIGLGRDVENRIYYSSSAASGDGSVRYFDRDLCPATPSQCPQEFLNRTGSAFDPDSVTSLSARYDVVGHVRVNETSESEVRLVTSELNLLAFDLPPLMNFKNPSGSSPDASTGVLVDYGRQIGLTDGRLSRVAAGPEEVLINPGGLVNPAGLEWFLLDADGDTVAESPRVIVADRDNQRVIMRDDDATTADPDVIIGSGIVSPFAVAVVPSDIPTRPYVYVAEVVLGGPPVSKILRYRIPGAGCAAPVLCDVAPTLTVTKPIVFHECTAAETATATVTADCDTTQVTAHLEYEDAGGVVTVCDGPDSALETVDLECELDGNVLALGHYDLRLVWSTTGATGSESCCTENDAGTEDITMTVVHVASLAPAPNDGAQAIIMNRKAGDGAFRSPDVQVDSDGPDPTRPTSSIVATVDPPIGGAEVYFGVYDPDDGSDYEPPGADDNVDVAKLGGFVEEPGWPFVPGSTQLDANGKVVRAAVASDAGGIVKIRHETTSVNAGDNYVVSTECVALPLGGMPPTEAVPVPANALSTAPLVAWRRVYLEHDRMFDTGGRLAADVGGDRNSDPDLLVSNDIGICGVPVNAEIVVFDSQDPVLWNPVTGVVDPGNAHSFTTRVDAICVPVGARWGIRVSDLPLGYVAGTTLPGRSAGWVLRANLQDAYLTAPDAQRSGFGGASNAGEDGGAFTEFVHHGQHTVVPAWKSMPEDEIDAFSEIWSSNHGLPNHLALFDIGSSDDPRTLGLAFPAERWSYVMQATIATFGVAGGASVRAHELAHHWFHSPQQNGGHHCADGHVQHCPDDGAGGAACPDPPTFCIMETGDDPCLMVIDHLIGATEFGGDTAPYHADDLYFIRERDIP